MVPREFADELYPRLTSYYEHDDSVTVIVDRRHFDRRGRARDAGDGGERRGAAQRRVVRDRRRARVPGDTLPLAHAT